ncbi:MAG: hypothetical protein LBV04_01005 [Deferribacteraceae bacterium]|nr:hypothetical protein [Deferribacteraceae bacterium]
MKKISLLVLIAMSLIMFGCSDDEDSGGGFVDDNFAPMPSGCEVVDLRDLSGGTVFYNYFAANYPSFTTARCDNTASLSAYKSALGAKGFSTNATWNPGIPLHGAWIIRGSDSYEFFYSDNKEIIGGGKVPGHVAIWGVGPASNAPSALSLEPYGAEPMDMNNDEEPTDGEETLWGNLNATATKAIAE